MVSLLSIESYSFVLLILPVSYLDFFFLGFMYFFAMSILLALQVRSRKNNVLLSAYLFRYPVLAGFYYKYFLFLSLFGVSPGYLFLFSILICASFMTSAYFIFSLGLYSTVSYASLTGRYLSLSLFGLLFFC